MDSATSRREIPEGGSCHQQQQRLRLRDPLFSAVLYLYFSIGFVLVVLPRVVAARLCFKGSARARRIQRLASGHLRGFFWLVHLLFRSRLRVSSEVRELSGRVLVCNHESYLDALLFVATFDRHLTVVKPGWFRLPIFGWFIRSVGYVAPMSQGSSAASLFERLESLREHLAEGGILYLFPEGHRSCDGRLGRFQPGAFKIARHLGLDVELLRVQGTAHLFPPGCASLRSRARAELSLVRLGTITSTELADAPSLNALVADVEGRYERDLAGG